MDHQFFNALELLDTKFNILRQFNPSGLWKGHKNWALDNRISAKTLRKKFVWDFSLLESFSGKK